MRSRKPKTTPTKTGPPTTSKLSDLFTTSGHPTAQSHDDLDSLIGFPSTSSPSPAHNSNPSTASVSPYALSPWNPSAASPYTKSPWIQSAAPNGAAPSNGLVASLVREEGHVYSLAASGDLLFTGSDSKNIRVWKGTREFAGFKSGSGLVKAIVVAGGKIFTGHQDGKIRVWAAGAKDPTAFRRVGTLPRLKDFLRSSLNPANYVEVRRHKNAVWLRHYDAVSCLSYDEVAGILYSGSWDRTVKAWRVSDSKCLESVRAHDDAVNAVAAAGFDAVVFTGSADGTVKAWRREAVGGGALTRHVLHQTLLEQDGAVTAVAVGPPAAGVLYGGCSDGLVHWWRWEKARRRMAYGGALRAHRTAVLCLAAAGAVVASGSADRTVAVWRRDPGGSHARLAVLVGHGGPVKCLALQGQEEDGEKGGEKSYLLYSGSLDRSVRIWRVSESDAEDGRIAGTATGLERDKNVFRRSPVQLPVSGVVSGAFGRRDGVRV